MCLQPSPRAVYFLCRYERTDEVRTVFNAFRSTLPLAPSYVYRLKRIMPGLFLTELEAKAISAALCEEGNPVLLAEIYAIEGRAL